MYWGLYQNCLNKPFISYICPRYIRCSIYNLVLCNKSTWRLCIINLFLHNLNALVIWIRARVFVIQICARDSQMSADLLCEIVKFEHWSHSNITRTSRYVDTPHQMVIVAYFCLFVAFFVIGTLHHAYMVNSYLCLHKFVLHCVVHFCPNWTDFVSREVHWCWCCSNSEQLLWHSGIGQSENCCVLWVGKELLLELTKV